MRFGFIITEIIGVEEMTSQPTQEKSPESKPKLRKVHQATVIESPLEKLKKLENGEIYLIT